ncbi:MAG TPA: RNA polymerase sigma factor [Chloroflexia bacterium]|nr:RNA polymerase sigma factor [Chloroflexia bacterium]
MFRPRDRKPPAKSNPDLPVTSQEGQEIKPGELDALIRASIRGDVDAFGELYKLYADQIYYYFFYRVRTDEEAQDLSSQVFFNAWKAIGRFRQENVPFLVWLYTIARNLLINYNKSNRLQSSLATLGEGIAEQVADHSESANPISLLINRTEKEELVRAYEQLNAEQQQVIYYRFVENWSHQEVARLMGKSEGAIRAIQFRALETLRRLLLKSAGEDNLG